MFDRFLNGAMLLLIALHIVILIRKQPLNLPFITAAIGAWQCIAVIRIQGQMLTGDGLSILLTSSLLMIYGMVGMGQATDWPSGNFPTKER